MELYNFMMSQNDIKTIFFLLNNWRLPRRRGKGLECAAAGDHVAAVAGGIQACTEDGTVPQIIRQRKLSATAALTLQL